MNVPKDVKKVEDAVDPHLMALIKSYNRDIEYTLHMDVYHEMYPVNYMSNDAPVYEYVDFLNRYETEQIQPYFPQTYVFTKKNVKNLLLLDFRHILNTYTHIQLELRGKTTIRLYVRPYVERYILEKIYADLLGRRRLVYVVGNRFFVSAFF